MITDESISLSGFYESIIENSGSHLLLLDDHCNIITFNPAFYWVFLEAYDVHLRKGSNFIELLAATNHHAGEKSRKRCSAALKGISTNDHEEFQFQGRHFSWKVYYKGVRLGQSKYVSILYRTSESPLPDFQTNGVERTILRSALDSIRSLICIVDLEYNVLEANEPFVLFFLQRFQTQISANVNFIESFSREFEEQRITWAARLSEALHQKSDVIVLDHVRLDSKDIIFETRICPVKIENRVIALIVSLEDIANRSFDESLQQTQMQELIKLNNELDRFVYSTSHDLRAPLLSIIGVVNLMKREMPENQYLKHIESSIIKLDNFVTNIINYSRNNRVEVLPGPVNFSLLIREANEALSYLDTVGLVHFTQQISDDQPFFSDATRITVVLKNLLSNAYQYFDPWKKSYVLVDVKTTREYAYIRIEDNGIGMKPEIKTRIFDMFFRGSDRSTGAGLGLYIVNNAIQKLDGKIDIRSTHGVGTVIELQIPNLIESV